MRDLAEKCSNQKTVKMKFWRCLCIYFCIHCIFLLVTERYEVSYRLEKQYKADLIFYNVCFSLNNLKGLANKTEFDFDQLSGELLDYFESRLPKPDSDRRFGDSIWLTQIGLERFESSEFNYLTANGVQSTIVGHSRRTFRTHILGCPVGCRWQFSQ